MNRIPRYEIAPCGPGPPAWTDAASTVHRARTTFQARRTPLPSAGATVGEDDPDCRGPGRGVPRRGDGGTPGAPGTSPPRPSVGSSSGRRSAAVGQAPGGAEHRAAVLATWPPSPVDVARAGTGRILYSSIQFIDGGAGPLVRREAVWTVLEGGSAGPDGRRAGRVRPSGNPAPSPGTAAGVRAPADGGPARAQLEGARSGPRRTETGALEGRRHARSSAPGFVEGPPSAVPPTGMPRSRRRRASTANAIEAPRGHLDGSLAVERPYAGRRSHPGRHPHHAAVCRLSTFMNRMSLYRMFAQ